LLYIAREYPVDPVNLSCLFTEIIVCRTPAFGWPLREVISLFASEMEFVVALRAGDEAAFATLVDMYHAKMLRLARTFVEDTAVAEEVTQEAWLGVLRGLMRFEGRSSLQTWIFTILTNCARTRAKREQRTIPFSSFFADDEEGEPTVDADRFHSSGPSQRHWRELPRDWHELPEQNFLAQETMAVAQRAIDALPANQRAVILLRDVDALSSSEVCNILDVSESNQRVLLHRARAKVQKALVHYFNEE
jgi:RNA polymerase sigma-70 factor (ECF subfamily)